MLLVAGASGNIGAEVVRAAHEAGADVRALTRSATSGVLPDGVVRVTGDLDQPATLRDALAGVDGVFLLPGYRDMPGLVAEAEAAGVKRVVLLSGSSAGDGDRTNAISRYMIDSEAAVRDSGLAWTILRPSGFMSNTLRWIPELRSGDTVKAPFAGVAVAVIDPVDIGAVAALSLLADGHERQVYRLSGPEALLPRERLAILGLALGRDLVLDEQSNDDARAEMTAQMPVEYVDGFFSFYVDGTLDESVVLPTVEEVTGRPARTFEQWVSAHLEAFR